MDDIVAGGSEIQRIIFVGIGRKQIEQSSLAESRLQGEVSIVPSKCLLNVSFVD